MSKWFEVRVQIWKTVLVEVEDEDGEEDAAILAYDEYLLGEDGETDPPRLLETEEEIASVKRHASCVLGL